MERRRHADIRLRAGGDDRPVDRPHHSARAPRRGGRHPRAAAPRRAGRAFRHRARRKGRPADLRLAHHLAGAQPRRGGRRSLEGGPRRHRAEAGRGAAAAAPRGAQPPGQEHARHHPGDRPAVAPPRAGPAAPSSTSFTGRLQALARAHDILVRGRHAACGPGRPGARAGGSRRARPSHRLDRARGSCSARAPRCSWRWCCTSLRRTRASTARFRRAAGRLAISWSRVATEDGKDELSLEWRESGAGATQGVGRRRVSARFSSSARSWATAGGRRSGICRTASRCDIRLPLPGPPPVGRGGGSGAEPAADAPLRWPGRGSSSWRTSR